MNPTWNDLTVELSRSVPNILGAILILVVGWLIAIVAAWIVKAVLSRTSLDNRLARWISGREDSTAVTNIEKWTASAVFWIIMIFVLVAFLQALQLTAVSQPLNNLLQQIFAYLPRIAGAALLLGVAWLVATLSRMLLVRSLKAFSLDEKLNQASTGERRSYGPRPPSSLEGVTLPQRDTLSQPQPRATAGSAPFTLSETLGNALYWFIFLLFLPAILGALQLEGLLLPVRNLLNEILNIVPNILAALIIAAIGWFVARIVQLLVTNLLTAIGFNNVFYWLGIQERPYQVPNVPPAGAPRVEEVSASPATLQQRTPSEVMGIIVLVGILLFTTVAATNALGFEALTVILTGLLLLLGRILTGLIVFAVGLYLANLAFKLIISSGSGQARVLAHAARVAIIVLISAMALQQIGVAPSIVNLAFGLLLGAIAVAIALAFGLGSMDIAAGEVRSWLDSFKRQERLPPR